MNQSPFPGGLMPSMPGNSSDGAAAIGALCTVLGVGFGWMIAQEQMAQARPPESPGQARNPYRNNREIATVADLEQWVLENQARLPNAPVVLRHLAQLPEQACLDQQTVRNLLTASR
ncbi:hypothetical protein RIF25_09495 [Thermosynechococcaceae cyanobacterium BACA0444]|uniref:Uncharacterized protein n=1 Tax=Pseudocalidococcus azoricus BACA0444 TaxID=2918990 RepID=A0AAE4JZN7_9CYAN|nr:hypothetical protein [Pseudocalidococcus azoricus]MDS3861042.1 hypothetical protein [Pseudocalidococcus azoricus BACA0444]